MKPTMLTALAAGASLLLASALSASADEITVTSFGGAFQESQRKAYFEPYMKQGHKITEEEYNGEIAKIKAMVEAGNVTWDVVDVDVQTALAGCAEGILEVIDWGKLGLDREKFPGAKGADCVVPTSGYATVFAYDTTKLNPGPTTINDVFDLQKFPGKRGLQKNPYMNLEWALMADGVPPEQVYEVLNTPEGVDRAFKKLDTIKAETVWWEAGAQPPQLLADGQVVITSAWNGRIYAAVKNDNKPFKIMWDREAIDWDTWAIPKGTPKLEEAYRFIAFASQPEVMKEQSKYISYGPGNLDAVPLISPEILEHLPNAPENAKTAFYPDQQFWADKGEELRERFNAWLAQ